MVYSTEWNSEWWSYYRPGRPAGQTPGIEAGQKILVKYFQQFLILP